jgi:hypothetical protein
MKEFKAYKEADMRWQYTLLVGVGVTLMLMSSASAQTAKGTSTSTKRAGTTIVFRTQPDPPKAGENQFEVTVKDKNGNGVTDAEVSVMFVMPAMPAMNMGEMRRTVKLEPSSGGVYRGKGEVPTAGQWNVTITVFEHGRALASKKLTITVK